VSHNAGMVALFEVLRRFNESIVGAF